MTVTYITVFQDEKPFKKYNPFIFKQYADNIIGLYRKTICFVILIDKKNNSRWKLRRETRVSVKPFYSSSYL